MLPRNPAVKARKLRPLQQSWVLPNFNPAQGPVFPAELEPPSPPSSSSQRTGPGQVGCSWFPSGRTTCGEREKPRRGGAGEGRLLHPRDWSSCTLPAST